jgi:hypothetical protein
MKEPPCAGNKSRLFINYFLIMTNPLKPLFGTSLGALEQLARRAAEAGSLAAMVRRELPEPVREHVVSATRRGEDMVVIVDSAAWAARVRYAGPALKQRLGQLGEPVAGKISVRVRRPAPESGS